MSNKTNIYTLGTSNSDVQNLSDVRRPSTFLEMFFLQIMEDIRNGNENLAGWIYNNDHNGKKSMFNDLDHFIYRYNNEKLEPYLEDDFLSWVRKKLALCIWSNGLENLRTMIEVVHNHKWYKKNSRLLELIDTHIKLRDGGSDTLDWSIPKHFTNRVFDDENMTETFRQEINQSFRDILFNHKLNELESILLHEYEIAMSKLPYCQHEVYDKRVKTFFELTIEQRKELWNTIIHIPLSNGNVEPLSEYLSENRRYYSVITNRPDVDVSGYVLSVMDKIIVEGDKKSMEKIVHFCSGEHFYPSPITKTGTNVLNLN